MAPLALLLAAFCQAADPELAEWASAWREAPALSSERVYACLEALEQPMVIATRGLRRSDQPGFYAVRENGVFFYRFPQPMPFDECVQVDEGCVQNGAVYRSYEKLRPHDLEQEKERIQDGDVDSARPIHAYIAGKLEGVDQVKRRKRLRAACGPQKS